MNKIIAMGGSTHNFIGPFPTGELLVIGLAIVLIIFVVSFSYFVNEN